MSGGLAAIVLAAGVNRRLGATPVPKAMLSLSDGEGPSFLERHVRILRELGVDPVTVVVSEEAAEACPEVDGLQVVVNPFDTSTTGSTLSMLCALRALDVPADHGVLISDADIVYERALMRWVVANCRGSRLFVAPETAGDDEEVRVYGRSADTPLLIGKGVSPGMVGDARLLGESLGIVHVAPEDRAFVTETSRWLTGWPPGEGSYGYSKARSEHEEVWQYCFACRRMAVAGLDDDLLFSECDTPEDLAYVRRELFPAILEREAGLRGAGAE